MMISSRRGSAAITKAEFLRRLIEAIQGATVPFAEYADEPAAFCYEVLGDALLTRKQEQILYSIRDNRITNVPAPFGVGKTWLASRAVLWWLFAVGGMSVTTAPTKRQVINLLWKEIRKAYDKNRDKLGGDRTETKLWLTDQIIAYGFTASRREIAAATGIHAAKLLGIIDEANGVSEEIDDAFESWMTGTGNRGLRIGNPIAGGTPFERACAHSGYVSQTCFEHPNVAWAYEAVDLPGVGARLKPDIARLITTDGGNGDGRPAGSGPRIKERALWPDKLPRQDKIAGAVSVEWIEDKRVKWGEGSSRWIGRVLGVFPSDASSVIVPREWFLAARARYDANPESWDERATLMPWAFGLDIGDGSDPHAIAAVRGDLLVKLEIQPTFGDMQDVSRAVGLALGYLKPAMETAERVEARREARAKSGLPTRLPSMMPAVNVDRIGVGSGVLARLIEWRDKERRSFSIRGINFGARARGRRAAQEYVNRRAQLYFALRERFRTGTIAVAPLGAELETRLMEELASIQWEERPDGRILVEAKDDVRARLGRSPDAADAVVYAYARGPEAGQKNVVQWA